MCTDYPTEQRRAYVPSNAHGTLFEIDHILDCKSPLECERITIIQSMAFDHNKLQEKLLTQRNLESQSVIGN